MLRGFSVLLDIFLADSRVKMRFINYVRARRYKPHSISMLVISGLSFSLSINIILEELEDLHNIMEHQFAGWYGAHNYSYGTHGL